MKAYQGKSISGGVAIGRIRVYRKDGRQVTPVGINDPDAECARFERAGEEALRQLRELYGKARREAGDTAAEIFRAHQMLLADISFRDSIENIIRSREVNAEYAVSAAGDQYARMFAAMDDEYMKERAADVRDVTERLITVLNGSAAEDPDKADQAESRGSGPADRRTSGGSEASEQADSERSAMADRRTSESLNGVERLDSRQSSMAGQRTYGEPDTAEPVIIVADDLTPSETIQLAKHSVLSFVTVHGSPNSHTAILARTMGIPALACAAIPPDVRLDGMPGIVDGTQGVLYVDPDEETFARMREKQRKEQENRELLQTLRGRENITADGQKVMLCANISDIKDLDAVIRNDADGIGLFRSEFIYLERDHFPTEEEQFNIYKQAAEAMAGRRVVIRTLDIGADKQCSYFGMEREENPALGCRAIRICLTRPEVFRTQLRALFRASAFGEIAIMYPMIISMEEIREIQELVRSVKSGLDAEGICRGEPEQGIMIETPAAALISDELAKEVDFFSIGTNDLIQYTLAIDRQNTKLDAFCDTHHPAVLRMISMVTEHAHRAGIRVGICGELAADPSLTREFLAMGVDELSVPPGNILPLRRIVLDTDVRAYRAEKDFS